MFFLSSCHVRRSPYFAHDVGLVFSGCKMVHLVVRLLTVTRLAVSLLDFSLAAQYRQRCLHHVCFSESCIAVLGPTFPETGWVNPCVPEALIPRGLMGVAPLHVVVPTWSAGRGWVPPGQTPSSPGRQGLQDPQAQQSSPREGQPPFSALRKDHVALPSGPRFPKPRLLIKRPFVVPQGSGGEIGGSLSWLRARPCQLCGISL